MDLFSGYTITPVAFKEVDKTQGSKLTVNDPQTDKTYTCRAKPDGQDNFDTSVKLDVYGTYLHL